MDGRAGLWSPKRGARKQAGQVTDDRRRANASRQAYEEDPNWTMTSARNALVKDFTAEISPRWAESSTGRKRVVETDSYHDTVGKPEPNRESHRAATAGSSRFSLKNQSPSSSEKERIVPKSSGTARRTVRLVFESSPERPIMSSSRLMKPALPSTPPDDGLMFLSKNTVRKPLTPLSPVRGQDLRIEARSLGRDGLHSNTKGDDRWSAQQFSHLDGVDAGSSDVSSSISGGYIPRTSRLLKESPVRSNGLGRPSQSLTTGLSPHKPYGKVSREPTASQLSSPKRIVPESQSAAGSGLDSSPQRPSRGRSRSNGSLDSPSRSYSRYNGYADSPSRNSTRQSVSLDSPSRNQPRQNGPSTVTDHELLMASATREQRSLSTAEDSPERGDASATQTSPQRAEISVANRSGTFTKPSARSGVAPPSPSKSVSPPKDTSYWSPKASAFKPSPGRPSSADRKLDFDRIVDQTAWPSRHSSLMQNALEEEAKQDKGSEFAAPEPESKGSNEHTAPQPATMSPNFDILGGSINILTAKNHLNNQDGGFMQTPSAAQLRILAPQSTSTELGDEEGKKWSRVADLLEMSGFDGTEMRRILRPTANDASAPSLPSSSAGTTRSNKQTVASAVERALASILRDYERQKKLIERSMEATKREDQYRSTVGREMAARDERIAELEAKLHSLTVKQLTSPQTASVSKVDASSTRVIEQQMRRWETRSRRLEEELARTRDQLEQEIQLGTETRKKAREEFERLLGKKASTSADARVVAVLEGFVQEQMRGLKSHVALTSNSLVLGNQSGAGEDQGEVTARTRDEIRDFAKRICELVLAHSGPQDDLDTKDVLLDQVEDADLVDPNGWFPTRVVAKVIPQISRWIAKAEEVDRLRFWREQVLSELHTESEDTALHVIRKRIIASSVPRSSRDDVA